jgi:hypothetical protein
MSKLICLAHPKYNGQDAPALSCKTCCGIFITQIKLDNENNMAEQDEKRRRVIQRRAASSKMGQSGLTPDMI